MSTGISFVGPRSRTYAQGGAQEATASDPLAASLHKAVRGRVLRPIGVMRREATGKLPFEDGLSERLKELGLRSQAFSRERVTVPEGDIAHIVKLAVNRPAGNNGARVSGYVTIYTRQDGGVIEAAWDLARR